MMGSIWVVQYTICCLTKNIVFHLRLLLKLQAYQPITLGISDGFDVYQQQVDWDLEMIYKLMMAICPSRAGKGTRGLRRNTALIKSG